MSIFGVILVHIQSKCGKIWTRITPNTDTFHAVYLLPVKLDAQLYRRNHDENSSSVAYFTYFFFVWLNSVYLSYFESSILNQCLRKQISLLKLIDLSELNFWTGRLSHRSLYHRGMTWNLVYDVVIFQLF